MMTEGSKGRAGKEALMHCNRSHECLRTKPGVSEGQKHRGEIT